jgi:hypothetical protein
MVEEREVVESKEQIRDKREMLQLMLPEQSGYLVLHFQSGIAGLVRS